MFKKIFFLILLFFFSFSQVTLAAFSFSIDSLSSITISSGEQEVDVNLSITDLPSESYFRVAIQKQTGGTYYGYVKNNNGDWVAIQPLSGDCSTYYRVTDTSQTTLQLKFKIGSNDIDNGSYYIKAHRFTSTGNCSSTKASNDYPVTVSFSTPTPTPTPVSTSTPTPTPVPTSTKSPTPKPSTPKPTSTPLATTISVSMINDKETTNSPVLAETTQDLAVWEDKTPMPSPTETKVAAENNFQKILITVGILFILSSGFWFIKSIKSKDSIDNE